MATRKATKKNRWRSARDTAGMATDDVVFALRTTFPERFWTSRSTINRLENGEDTLDLCQMIALARIYNTPLRDIDPLAAIDYEEWRERVGTHVVSQSPCFVDIPTQTLVPA